MCQGLSGPKIDSVLGLLQNWRWHYILKGLFNSKDFSDFEGGVYVIVKSCGREARYGIGVGPGARGMSCGSENTLGRS